MLKHFRIKKRGVASLEFVMCLPFIVLVTAIIFRIGMAAMTKTKVAIDVRREVWQARDQYDSSQSSLAALQKESSNPLAIASFFKPLSGEISGEANQSVSNYTWLGGNKTAVSKSTIIGQTWDHRDLPLMESDSFKISLILQIIGLTNPEQAAKIQEFFDLVGDIFFNPEDLLSGNEDISDANGEIEEQKEEIRQKLEAARQKLAEYKEEQRQLLERKSELELEKARLIFDISGWEDEDPMTPATRDKISAARSRIRTINNELDRINRRLDTLEELIDYTEQEIATYEQALSG